MHSCDEFVVNAQIAATYRAVRDLDNRVKVVLDLGIRDFRASDLTCAVPSEGPPCRHALISRQYLHIRPSLPYDTSFDTQLAEIEDQFDASSHPVGIICYIGLHDDDTAILSPAQLAILDMNSLLAHLARQDREDRAYRQLSLEDGDRHDGSRGNTQGCVTNVAGRKQFRSFKQKPIECHNIADCPKYSVI